MIIALATMQGTTQADTFGDALGRALAEHPALEAERQRQEATETERTRAIGRFLPEVDGFANFDNETNTSYPTSGYDPEWTHGYGVSVTQPLFRGYRSINGLRRARNDIAAGEHELRDSEQTVLLDSALAYAAMIRDRSIHALRRKNAEIIGRILLSAQIKFREGEATRTDIAQSESRLMLSRTETERASAEEAKSESEYRRQIGQNLGELVRMPPGERFLPGSREEAVTLAKSQSPKYLASVLRALAAINARDESYGALMPSIDLRAVYSRDHDTSLLVRKEDNYQLGLRISVPLFSAEKYADIGYARATARLRNFEPAHQHAGKTRQGGEGSSRRSPRRGDRRRTVLHRHSRCRGGAGTSADPTRERALREGGSSLIS